MSDEKPQIPPAFFKEVVYRLPYSGTVRQDIPYGAGSEQFDIFYPESCEDPVPVVIFIMGFPDSGFKAFGGSNLKNANPYQSWARLIAASGMAAVLYTTDRPAADILDLIEHLQDNSKALNIDADTIGPWSCSGNVPNAIHVINSVEAIQCAALCYGFMLDLNNATTVADASARFHFVNPNEGIGSFPEETPLLVVRAGKDEFSGLNAGIEAFVSEAGKRNTELELIDFAEGVHSFDVLDESEASVEVVKRIVEFLSQRLNVK